MGKQKSRKAAAQKASKPQHLTASAPPKTTAFTFGEPVPVPVPVGDAAGHRRHQEDGLEDVQQGGAAHHEGLYPGFHAVGGFGRVPQGGGPGALSLGRDDQRCV